MADFLIYAGPSATGKSTMLRREIEETTLKDPSRRIIMIVPEQATLLTQQDILREHERHGMLQVEVLSFNRLAWRIFNETGTENYQTFDDCGKSMLLMKTAIDHQEELVYYKNHAHRQGFIGQLKIMMTEMYQYRIDQDALQRIRASMDPISTLYRKLTDIMLIASDFRLRTQNGTIPSEELLDVLEKQIPYSRLLEGADIYIDGFYGFTPQQYAVIAALYKKARHMRMALTMEAEALSDSARNDDPMNASSRKILIKLKQLGIHGRIKVMLHSYQKPLFVYLSRCLFQLHPDPFSGSCDGLLIHRALRPEEEAEWVLSQIAQDLRESSALMYRDIAVLCENETVYTPILSRLGRRYGIPLYIDQKETLETQPLADLLLSMLRSVRSGFTYDSIFSWLKNPFFSQDQNQIDQLENQALKEGWRGKKPFLSALEALPEETNASETIRIFELLSTMSGQHPVMFYIKTLREILSMLPVEQTVEAQMSWHETHENFSAGQVCIQVPDAICSVLDQMEAVLGSDMTDIRGFYEVFLCGLKQTKISSVPPSEDMVQVVNLKRSRLPHVKRLYIIGFQDDAFPAVPDEAGLLTDRERQKIAAFQDVAADSQQQLLDGQAALRGMIGRVSEKLVFSYSISDGHGKSLRPSRYIDSMCAVCPELEINKEQPRPMHTQWLLDHLAKKVFEKKDEDVIRKWLIQHGYEQALEKFSYTAAFRIPQENLSTSDVRLLFALNQCPVSITQLEQYASCPLSYFFRYGVKLSPREILSVRPLDDGNVLHALLEAAGPGMLSLSDDDIANLMDRLIQEEAQFGRYLATSRYRFYWNQLKETASWAVKVQKQQVRSGNFVPEAFEWTFGGGRVPALPLVLDDGERVLLRGKIDRIDVMKTGEKSYARIIDYKSGRTKWKNWDVYDGLKLQLPLYLDAVQYARGLNPAGMFYFHLTQKVLPGVNDASEEEQYQKMLLDAHLDGVMLNDDDVISGMDENLDAGSSSIVTGLRLNKNGTVRKDSMAIDEEQFLLIRKQARKTAATIASNIARGKMSPHPVREENGRTACTYCDYSQICRLEASRHQAWFKDVSHHKNENFWDTVRAEISDLDET